MGGEWGEKSLGDLLKFSNGKSSPDRADSLPVPVFGSNGIIGRCEHENSPAKSLIIGRVGSYCGSVYYSNKPCWVTDNAIKATAINGHVPKFLFYVLDHLNLNSWREGSGQPLLNQSILKSICVDVPPIEEQHRIAHTLSTLDDKIELNRQMNTTLESMAQALFKSWFVDFDPVIDNALAAGNDIPDALQAKAAKRKALGAKRKPLPDGLQQQFPDRFVFTEEMGWVPEGWGAGPISNLAKLNPESWTAKKHPEYITYVDLANTKDGRINDTTDYEFSQAPSRARRVLRAGDTIVGTVRPGNRSFAYIGDDNLTGSTGFAVMRPTEQYHRSFVYLSLTQDETIRQLAHLADGAAYPAIRPEVVASHVVTLPPPQILSAFDTLTFTMLSTIEQNEVSNGTLASLRDTLLPKLLSGELRIPDAEKQLAEAL